MARSVPLRGARLARYISPTATPIEGTGGRPLSVAGVNGPTQSMEVCNFRIRRRLMARIHQKELHHENGTVGSITLAPACASVGARFKTQISTAASPANARVRLT
jgi:hypothetical protein